MRFVGMLRSDFRRMFHSKSFYFSILGIFAITFFSVWPEIPASQYDVSVYYLTEVRRGIGAFFMAVTVVVVLPYALSYRVDMRHNYIHCLESRAGVSACCWSHVVVTAVGAFLAVFLGYSLFFGVLGFGLPMIKPDEIEMLRVYRESGDLGIYDGLMLSEIPALCISGSIYIDGIGKSGECIPASQRADHDVLWEFAVLQFCSAAGRFLVV